MTLTPSQRLYGSTDPLPERLPLRAGPLTLVVEAGDLRSIRVDGVDVINRIYGAVRDGNWATIPGRISNLQIEAGERDFRISYVSEHVRGAVDFVWRAAISGSADGTIAFAFAGEARAAFARNRIGLCVLHPLTTCAGRPALARLVGGGTRDVCFPLDVSVEQPLVGFHSLAGLHWAAAPGVEVDLTLEGDTFETEDQRNWIDPSFKTYSTPLSLPRPVQVPAGTRMEQRVVLRVAAPPKISWPSAPRADWGQAPNEGASQAFGVRPQIGVGTSEHPASTHDVARLRLMRPAHLRVDLPLDGDWEPRLRQAAEQATAIGCALELALDVGPDPRDALRRLADSLPPSPPVARVIVFGAGEMVTTHAALDAVREHLAARRPGLGPLASGSRMDLYQVHLFDPPRAEVTCWGMQPQAHATDLTSISETPVAAGHQVRAVKMRRPGPVAISPVRLHRTLADPRQMSLAGAAWALSLLAELVAAGADSITIFETVGPRGVMADAVGVFPVYHVLADVIELAEGSATILRPADGVTGLLLRNALLLANLSREPRSVALPDRFDGRSLRMLDAASVADATETPDSFRRGAGARPADSPITLPPFATARVDRRGAI